MQNERFLQERQIDLSWKLMGYDERSFHLHLHDAHFLRTPSSNFSHRADSLCRDFSISILFRMISYIGVFKVIFSRSFLYYLSSICGFYPELMHRVDTKTQRHSNLGCKVILQFHDKRDNSHFGRIC